MSPLASALSPVIPLPDDQHHWTVMNENTTFPVCSTIPDGWPTPGLRATIEASAGFFAGKRALVTGAFGFVGGHLARALHAAGAEVIALDLDTSPGRCSQLNMLGLRHSMQIALSDITDRRAIQGIVTRGQFDHIFHIAAGATVIEKALHDPYETIMANTMGFVNIAEAVRLLPAEQRPVIIYSSTDKVYGEAEILPYTEDSLLGGVGVYDAAKLAADIFAGTYDKALGVPTIVLRMCNLFGPYDFNSDYRLIPKALRNIFRDGQAPELYAASQEHFRDYCYVEDAVRAFLLMAQCKGCHGRVYNLPGTHYCATPEVLREVVETVGELQDEARRHDADSTLARLEWRRDIQVVPSDPNLITISKQHLDGTRIGREAGFAPQTEFTDGLRRTALFYNWYFNQHLPAKNGANAHAARREAVNA
jgi:nucleoside-diphosphate-sugar epimerase